MRGYQIISDEELDKIGHAIERVMQLRQEVHQCGASWIIGDFEGLLIELMQRKIDTTSAVAQARQIRDVVVAWR